MANTVRPDQILNYLPLNDRITTSGQPSEAQLAALRDEGAEIVLNLALHTHPKALADEASTVASLGMGYIHIPVDFQNPTEADYAQFRTAMDAHGGSRVHVHCILNARVTAFLYRYQQERLGASAEQARAFMERVWKPGGVWAAFIGEADAADRPHGYCGNDYPAS